MKRATPWLVAGAALVFAGWSWARPAVSPPVTDECDVDEGARAVEDENSGAEPDPTAPLRATQECLARLELAQAALDRRERDPAADGEGPACLSDPAVAAVLERRVEAAIEQHVADERAREQRATDRVRSAFDEWSTQSLGILPHEQAWLESYVCAARELRNRTLDALDEVPAEDALEELRRQRKQILADLEQALGPDRYATLRTIGGIGLLADTTDCSAG